MPDQSVLSVLAVRERAAAVCDRIQRALGYGNVALTRAQQIRSMPVTADEPLPEVIERAAKTCEQIQSALGFGQTASFCADAIRESPSILTPVDEAKNEWAMPVVRPEFMFSKDQREKIEAAFDAAIRNSPVLSVYYGVNQPADGAPQ